MHRLQTLATRIVTVVAIMVTVAHLIPTSQAGFTLVQASGMDLDPIESMAGRDWSSWLDPQPTTYIPSATGTFQDELEESFPTWTFTYDDDGLSGTMTIEHYKATAKIEDSRDAGGADILATYDRATNDPALTSLHFIQLVRVEVIDPATPSVVTFIDPVPNDDDKPFYWTLLELQDRIDEAMGTIEFEDRPWEYAPEPGMTISWTAETMLASWSGGTIRNVTIHDGFRWGFQLTRRGSEPPGGGTLSFVPEPRNQALIGLGLLGLACLFRRRLSCT